jgi:deoxyadenosine/deoxycytidine kinase
MIISVEGNIGSGKSTVLEYVKNKEKVFQEDLDNWGTWIEDFYSNPEKNSFGFQMRVLLSQSYIKNNTNDILFHERSPLTCNYIFGNILQTQNHLSYPEHSICLEFANKYCWEPSYIIYIKTEPDICKQRILERNRSGENIDISYLKLVHKYHEDMYNREDKKIYIINGHDTKENIFLNIDQIIKNIKMKLNNNSFLNKN